MASRVFFFGGGGVPSLIDKQAITYFTVIGDSKQKLLFS